MYYIITPTNNDLQHHGILGQKWGTRNGPPYPLTAGAHSSSEKSAGWKKSLSSASYGGGYQKKKRLSAETYNKLSSKYESKRNKIKESSKTDEQKDKRLNRLDNRYNKKLSKYNDYDVKYHTGTKEAPKNNDIKTNPEKQKQISERLNRAKTEGKYELTFLEAVQNSDIANRGDEKSKKALLKEYEIYLNDRENYWDRAKELKEWQGPKDEEFADVINEVKNIEREYKKYLADPGNYGRNDSKTKEKQQEEIKKREREYKKYLPEKDYQPKTEDEQELDELRFMDVVQNSDVFNRARRGDKESQKALQKEYEIYSKDRESYWDRARGLKEWQGDNTVSSETYGSPFSKKNSKSANSQSPQKGTTEYESQKQDALQKGKASDVLNFKGDLTNQQLQYAVDRIRLENTLSDYSSKETSTTWSKVNNIMNNVNTVNNWANIALNSANTAERVYNKLFPEEKKKN